MKEWIGVDLDGTLAYYDGWKGPDHIGDPLPVMVERIHCWLEEGIKVKIFTARACIPEQIPPVEAWLKKVGLPDLEITNLKDFGMVVLWDGPLCASSPQYWNTNHRTEVRPPMPTRNCKNWFRSLMQYVEETESPRSFWTWAGIHCIAASLQRKVWVPYGLEDLYPNLYIMIVAPPGRCRKGSPVSFAKKILKSIDIHVYSDSPTKRALTKDLDKQSKLQTFKKPGSPVIHQHCSTSLVSKELSSFLAIDPKSMIEVLTDLYDCHDVWDYSTGNVGEDKLKGVCLNCIFATTPTWIANNLPEEAIGGGFTSRFALVAATEKHKWVPIPPIPSEEEYELLRLDLAHISSLVGAFSWDNGAEDTFRTWYASIEGKVKNTKDERLHGYLERMHIMVLKAAMVLRVSYSDSLLLTSKDISLAIGLMEDVLLDAPKALSGHGRSRLSVDTHNVLRQVRAHSPVSFTMLLQMNYRNTTKPELEEIMETIVAMGEVKVIYDQGKSPTYIWETTVKYGKGGKSNRKPMTPKLKPELEEEP